MCSIEQVKQFLFNVPGWRSKRKIIVFHSDDWGSIRMPSNGVREKLRSNKFIDVSDPYCQYDTLASAEDLEALFEVLLSAKDKNGKPVVLTANCLMANPDFDKIRQDNFEKYTFETIDTTFARYKNESALKLWREGEAAGIFVPQFHGREHVNVPLWLKTLRDGHDGARLAFDLGVFGANFLQLAQNQKNLQRAWDLSLPESCEFVNQAIEQGLQLFEKRFGYRSRTAIAPNYTWSPDQEMFLGNLGVVAMQGMLRQRKPIDAGKSYQYSYRFTGKSGKTSSIDYQRRNIFFEPSLLPGTNWDKEIMDRIQTSFYAGKPAIIGTHRINFVGVLSKQNRDENLKLLRTLLKKITSKWPDAEFMSASQLATIM